MPIVNYQRTDVRPLLKLTDRLFNLGFFASYLTAPQLVVLESLLSIADQSTKLRVWKELMNGNVVLDVVKSIDPTEQNSEASESAVPEATDSMREDNTDNVKELSQNGNDDADDGDRSKEQEDEDLSQLDLEDFKQQITGADFIQNLSLKLRYVIWQCALDYMYKDERDDLNGETDDSFGYILLEEEVQEEELEKDDEKIDLEKDRNEEDDYDEDDDYDEEGPKKAPTNEEQNASSIEVKENSDNLLTIILTVSKVTLSRLRNNNNEEILKNSNRIYHNFEHDRENMLKRLRLEENDKLLDGTRNKRGHGDLDGPIDEAKDEDLVSKNGENGSQKSNDDREYDRPTEGKRPKHDPMGLPVNLGAANLSLKHLLASIQENKSSLQISDYELKHLIMDVRKNRSKWASDDKIGQEELYEACEKVVLELRNYTEHSTPFLNKVSKREAPNYHLIIKKSMDLNTVLKKLKTFQYESKQSFVDDVMLIWKNCLLYNSDPSHFLRGHAIAMQKKSMQLIPLIPDIVIRNRADVEKELEEMDKDRDYDEEEEEVAGSGRKGLNMGAHKPAKVAHDRENMDEAAGQTTDDHTAVDISADKTKTPQKAPPAEQVKQEEANAPAAEKKPNGEEGSRESAHGANGEVVTNEESQSIQNTLEEDEDEDEEMAESHSFFNEKDDDRDDVEIAVWKSVTAKVRAEICLKRSQYFENGILNTDSKAFLKDAYRMKTFEQLYTEYSDQKEIEIQRKQLEKESIMKNGFHTAVKQEEDDQVSFNADNTVENPDPFEKDSNDIEVDSTLFLTEYDSVNGLPATAYQGTDARILDMEEDACVKRMLEEGESKPSPFLANCNKGMTPMINKNVGLIQHIRHICHKISVIRLLQSPAANQNARANPNQLINTHQYKFEAIDDSLDIDPVSQLPTRDSKSNRQLMWRIMHRNVSKVTMSNGFETAQPSAINILTEIASDYLSNLVKSVKMHHESNSLSTTNSKEILQMSLLENGISRPDDLFVYYEAEFTKKTKKLLDIKSKLEGFLKDLLRPTLQELNERNFEDESQSFLTGDFATEITGEDFFGFKELGLEKEFGVLSSSVPIQLLTFQSQASDGETEVQVKKVQPEEFSNVPYSKLTREELTTQAHWATLVPLLEKAWQRSKSYRQRLAKISSSGDQTAIDEMEKKGTELLLEDDEMTYKAKSGKPRLPPTGKISTTYKKKSLADAFILPEEDEANNVAGQTATDNFGDTPVQPAAGGEETSSIDASYKQSMPEMEDFFSSV